MRLSKKNGLDQITATCECGCGRKLYIFDFRYAGMLEKNQFIQIGGVTGNIKEWRKLFNGLLKRVKHE